MTTAPPEATVEIHGVAIDLEAYGPANAQEVADLDARRFRHPVMAGSLDRPPYTTRLDLTLVARSLRDGKVVGTVDARAVPGHDEVVNLVLFFDPEIARPGLAMEAFSVAVPYLLDRGVRIVHQEVLACNLPMLRILRRAGIEEQAAFREHAFAAGRFWDVHVFAMDREGFMRMASRLQRVVPAAGGSFAAIGGRRG